MPNPLKYISIDKLELDPSNPRLPNVVGRTQEVMLNYIARSTAIEDLMSSISANGFFPGEPLVVIPSDREGVYIVVEGNRRLTAVKLLVNPQLCDKPTNRMLELSASITEKSLFTLLPVLIQKDRSAVLPYLGFRHITGVKQWEPLAKSRYMKQLFDLTDGSNCINERYQEVARSIGSKRDYIKRCLDALTVYEIIEAEDFYQIPGLNEESIKFAVLSTALADEKIGLFVRLCREENGDVVSNEVILHPERLDKDAVKELVIWLFKRDSEGKTKVGESRNIRYLAAVVNNAKAVKALREGATLQQAYEKTTDISLDFMELLYRIDAQLGDILAMLPTVKFDKDVLDLASVLNRKIKWLVKTLQDKIDEDERI